jgi:hypothetical protein
MNPSARVHDYEKEGIDAAVPADVHQDSVDPPPQRPSSCFRSQCFKRITCVVFVLAVAIIGAVALSFAFGGPGTAASWFGKGHPPNINGTELWDVPAHQGLTLELLNALEDKWTPIFDDRVALWDSGTPDALTLTTSKVTYDFGCTSVDGKVKVCNGNYGATDWKGLTTTFLYNDFIQHAVATMNDYFLDNENDASKYYTMCHELGHSFGLAHTDENFYNKDEGNCMDYTSWPQNNMNPGQFNYDHLSQMYGVVNLSASTGSSTPTVSSTATGSGATSVHHNGSTRRGLRRLDNNGEAREAPQHIKEKYKSVADAVKTKSCLELEQQAHTDQNVRMLHKNNHGEECSISLGEGYSVRIHRLLVVE